MDIETYGGKCPKCSKNMMQKGDTGHGTWFSYDACVWCGFAYGSVNNDEFKTKEIWETLFTHYDVINREGLIEKLNLSEHVSKEDSEFYPSVFNYTGEALEKIEKMNRTFFSYQEVQGDLFETEKSYALAHCISADFALGAGIAKEFANRYPRLKERLALVPAQVGDAIGYPAPDGRIIFNLVTKEKYHQKPTYQTFEDSIVSLKNKMVERNINRLAIPTLGAGLDKLEWEKNSTIIQGIFKDTDIEILVCMI